MTLAGKDSTQLEVAVFTDTAYRRIKFSSRLQKQAADYIDL